MTAPGFAAEALYYATTQCYRAATITRARSSDSVSAQQLCRHLGQSCGGVDLFCCPGLRCTAPLGGHGICLPDIYRHGTRDRRADHAAVQHPRHLDVGDVVEGAKDLGRDIEARRRLADDLVGEGRFGLCLRLGDEVVAELAVPLHRQIEIAPADQLAISRLTAVRAFSR